MSPGTDGADGLAAVREEVDGHPMANLLGYARPYWARLSLGILTSLVTRLTRLAPPLIVAVAIDRVVMADGGPGLLAEVGLVTAQPIPAGATAMRLALLERLVVIAVLAYLVRAVTRFVSRYLLESTAQKIQRDLRDDTYDHIQRLSMDFFANHQTGEMMSVLNNDVNRLEQFLNTELRQAVRVVAIVGGIGAVLWYIHPPLAAIALAPVPVIGLASGRFLTWIEPKYQGIRETVARLNARLENNLGGVRVIKTFDRYDFETGRVAEQSQAYHDEKVEAIKMRRAFFSALRVVTGAVFVLTLYVGGRAVIAGALTVGLFAMAFMFIRRLYSPMRRIGKTANKYQLAKASAERVFGVLGHEPALRSPADPYRPDRIEGEVRLDGVTFGYPGGDAVLRDVDLEVAAGETVGVAGPTGAGKSTLVALLPRFHDVDEGSVTIDGVDVRDYDLQTLRSEVGIVEQDPYLFSGSVRANIAYGAPADLPVEAVPERRIREAAEAAAAHEFIADLPDGYDTWVGERGIKLSGGQRQRLAIARALLNDPSIVILDEATSDVDTETEAEIQRHLDRLCADRTAFVIAHRLSTIQDADRIVVMEDGRVVEQGSHGDLVAARGEYADLWRAQSEAVGATSSRAEAGD